MSYFKKIIIAFIAPVAHGWSNIIDSYLSGRIFSRLSILIFIGSVVGIILLPVVFLIDPPHLPPIWSLAPILFISLIDIFYLFPYYWSLRNADTSVVASLFSLGKIFVPLLAFYIVGERLTYTQYLGFFIIIASTFSLNFNLKKFKLNPAFFLMLGVSFILSIQTVVYKYIFDTGVSWGTVMVTMAVFELVISSVLMLVSGAVYFIKEDIRKVISNWRLFTINELLGWGGNLGETYAVSILPVSMVKGIDSTQPLFVLAYALFFKKKNSKLFKEYIKQDGIIKKTILFSLIIVGIMLIV